MTDAQLTPIGTSPAWSNPGDASSGFLLEAGDRRVLIDCGSGVVARYLELYGIAAPIDAVVITHVHADHIADLVPLKYGIDYGNLTGWSPELWLPPGAHERLLRFVSTWDGPRDFFTDTFSVRDYTDDAPFAVGPFSFTAHEVPHFIEAHALRATCDGASFGYTSDLGPDQEVSEFMRGVDLLLTEATLPVEHGEPGDGRGHLTAEEAGEIAQRAGAHSLLLTHVPSELQAGVIARARSRFEGPIALARSGQAYALAKRLARAV